jgi:hypothetical protein
MRRKGLGVKNKKGFPGISPPQDWLSGLTVRLSRPYINLPGVYIKKKCIIPCFFIKRESGCPWIAIPDEKGVTGTE